MNIFSKIKNVEELLVGTKFYYVTRFQREYAWDKEDLQEFWNDITSNLIEENNNFIVSDYFIGSMVMITDNEDKKNFK